MDTIKSGLHKHIFPVDLVTLCSCVQRFKGQNRSSTLDFYIMQALILIQLGHTLFIFTFKDNKDTVCLCTVLIFRAGETLIGLNSCVSWGATEDHFLYQVQI